MKTRTQSWPVLFLWVSIAAFATGCGRLRPNGDEAPPAATFTPAAPVTAPTEAPAQAVEPTAAPVNTAAAAPTPFPTDATAPTAPAATAPAPTATVIQSDTSGAALDDLLGGLLNGVADDPTFQSELDQIP